jgi:hypothetical protein
MNVLLGEAKTPRWRAYGMKSIGVSIDASGF